MANARVERTGPILVGALVGGIASGLPFIGGFLNLCCCSPYIAAGVIAGAMFAGNAAKVQVFPGLGGGAGVGALSGLVAGVIAGLMQGIFGLLTGGPQMGDLDRFGPMDPEARRLAETIVETMSGPIGIVLIIVLFCVAGLVFGAIGGAIGTAVRRKPPTAPPPAAAPLS